MSGDRRGPVRDVRAHQARRSGGMTLTVAACRCAAIACISLLPGLAAAQTPPVPARHLVIPFENLTKEPRVFWLGEGSAVMLSDDLLALGVQAISRDDRLRAFDRLRVPAVASLSYATVIRLGQIVGAAQVVVGGFAIKDEQLTVRARAIRLDTGRMTPEIVESGPLVEIYDVYARVARRLAPESRPGVAEREQGHPPSPAFEQYIKGLLAEAPAARVSILTQAVRIYPALHQKRIALWSVHTDQRQHKQALTVVRQVPSDHRLARQAQFLAAVSMLHLGQYQEAHDALTALNRDSPDPALLNNLGVVQLRRP